MTQRVVLARGAVIALACSGLLGLGACGNDEPAPADETPEVEVIDDDGGADEEEGPAEVVTIKADPEVDPTRELPRVKPPAGITHTPRPGLPDAGAKPSLPTGPLEDVGRAVQRMGEYYEVAITPVPRPAGRPGASRDRAALEQFQRYRDAIAQQGEALERLVNLGERYVTTVGAEGAEPVPRFYFGYALTSLADKTPKPRADQLRQEAVPHLSGYLAGPEKAAAYVADAEYLLGMTLLKVGGGEGGEVGRAVRHLVNASALFQAQERQTEAARAAHFALDTLIQHGREDEALAAAEKMGAATADFGPQTRLIQRLLRRAGLYPGAPMPDFGGLLDADGAGLSLAALRGSPVIVHLFQTSRVDGKPSAGREVETVLVPLARTYGPKGLKLIGGCLDLRLSDEQIERIKANWEEWGIKERLRDGSLAEARAWCANVGMDWPFHYDGKWTQNALASHLGLDQPYAFLLDAEGKVAWRGAPPYLGLEQVLTGLME